MTETHAPDTIDRRRPIRYYLPADLVPRRRELLGHLPEGQAMLRTKAGVGPDVGPAGSGGGGLVVGGRYEADETGWQLTAAGYYIHAGDATPNNLAKLVTVPGFFVPGIVGHVWQVPTLAGRVQLGDGSCVWRSVLGREVLGPDGTFQLVVPYEDVTRRLTAAVDAAERQTVDDLPALAALAIEILAINYDVTQNDLGGLGWFEKDMIPTIHLAAIGVDPDMQSEVLVV